MQTYQVYCEGVSPLLMNQASQELLDGIREGVTPPKNRTLTKEAIAAKCIYREGLEPDSPIVIPIGNLFKCLVLAGRYVPGKMARSKVSTAESTILPLFLSLTGINMPLVIKTPDGDLAPISNEGWVPDMRRGCNPGVGKLVAIVRPRFDRWGFRVSFELDEQEMHVDVVHKLFDIGGKAIGLCDFRPQKQGTFGRFKVVDWEKVC